MDRKCIVLVLWKSKHYVHKFAYINEKKNMQITAAEMRIVELVQFTVVI